jgi:hypothetical protein
MLVILGIEKLDWNTCKRTLKDPLLIEKLSQVNKERAAAVLEEITPMMEESRQSMDPEYMITKHHHGAVAICHYVLAVYNMGAEELGLPPFVLNPPTVDEGINLDWQTIKLQQIFDKMKEAKEAGLHVIIQDTTD